MFGCTGWCGNNPDGSATMEIQGPRVKIEMVIFAIRSCRRIRIQHMDSTVIPAVPEETGFISRYYFAVF